MNTMYCNHFVLQLATPRSLLLQHSVIPHQDQIWKDLKEKFEKQLVTFSKAGWKTTNRDSKPDITQTLFCLTKIRNSTWLCSWNPERSQFLWFQSSLKDIELVFSGLDCYNTNRFVPVQNETEIERLAHISQNNGSFLAGWSKLQASSKKQKFILKPLWSKTSWYDITQ